MLKKRKASKTEKQHPRGFNRPKRETRAFRATQRSNYETTMFAVFRSKSQRHSERLVLKNKNNASLDENKTSSSVTNFWGNNQLRRSSRLNPPLLLEDLKNQEEKETTTVASTTKFQRHESKSIFKEICDLVKAKSQEQNQRKEKQKQKDYVLIEPVNKPPFVYNDGFMTEASLQATGLWINENSLKMNIENKIKHFNNILKGTSSPNCNRNNLKRKQNENNENEMSIRLFSPSKYVYSTPENQKYRPQIPIKKSPDLIPAVFQTTKKLKVLYDIDKNVAMNLHNNNKRTNNKNVSIDKRFLKPICTSSNVQEDNNQFLKAPFECSMDLTEEISSIQTRYANTTNPLKRLSPISNSSLQQSPILEEQQQQVEENLNFTFVNHGNDSNVYTFQEIPHSSKYVPTPTINNFQKEMDLKCTVRPAKLPRPVFHRTLSRKSLNFEPSPTKSLPEENHHFTSSTSSYANFEMHNQEAINFGHSHSNEHEHEHENANLYEDSLDSFQLNMNISLNDEEEDF